MALSTTGTWEKLLDLPTMAPKFGWTMGVLDGLVAYAEYHIREITRASFKEHGEAGR